MKCNTGLKWVECDIFFICVAAIQFPLLFKIQKKYFRDDRNKLNIFQIMWCMHGATIAWGNVDWVIAILLYRHPLQWKHQQVLKWNKFVLEFHIVLHGRLLPVKSEQHLCQKNRFFKTLCFLQTFYLTLYMIFQDVQFALILQRKKLRSY